MSSGRGGGDRPLTYKGAFDVDRTYLPRDVVVHDGRPYMATAKMQGTEPTPVSGTAVLFVSTLADGPPTDGSVFWYVTDESC